MQKPLKTAVIGAGKMGRLHSRIYSQMDRVELVGVVDSDFDKAEQIAQQYGAKAYRDASEIIDLVDAVTIAVPTEFHPAVAKLFLARRIPVLVEKPLASSVPQAKELLNLARQSRTILQVGYSERFNPAVQAMQRIKFTPRFVEAQRISPYTFRSTDVGVVLDMMIHDIDIILSLVAGSVKDVHAVGVNVLGQQEDIANVRLIFESGCVANLTASRLALKTERKIRLFSEDAYLSLDYLKKTGTMISKAANIDMVKWLAEKRDPDGELDVQNVDWAELVKVENLDIDDREPLRLEQESFVKAIADGSRPQVSAEDAVAAMVLAERIIESIGSHRWDGDSSSAISSRQWRSGDIKAGS